MNNETLIADQALQAFEQQTQIKGVLKPTQNRLFDGTVDLYLNGKTPKHFLIEVKKEIRNHHLPKLLEQAAQHRDFIVIAEHIYPNTKKELQDHNIGYLETNGNVFLRNPGNYLIWIDHHEPVAPAKKINRAFTKTGLRVLFMFLLDETLINLTYREIADKADVGLGNVNNIINGLKALKLIVRKNNHERLFPDKRALLEKWVGAFDERLKPTLHRGNYRFLNKVDFFKWREIKFKTDQTIWGGEPAGDLYTNNLNPEILTIYTTEGRDELMRNYRLVPDPEGNVQVFAKFWRYAPPTRITTAVPAVLAYADLINTGNQRCINTALTIYDNNIKD